MNKSINNKPTAERPNPPWSIRMREGMERAGIRNIPHLFEVMSEMGFKSDNPVSSKDLLSKYVRGYVDKPRGDVLEYVARAIKVPYPELMHGPGSAATHHEEIMGLSPSVGTISDVSARSGTAGRGTLPVRGRRMTERPHLLTFAGDGSESDIIEYIDAPPRLLGVPAAYAAYALDDKMSPRIELGEIACVNPNQPPKPGDDVMVIWHVEKDQVGQIRRFVGMDDRDIRLEQFNPPKVYKMPRKQVAAIQRIVWIGPRY